jgi:GT2 family glycosyltransferase
MPSPLREPGALLAELPPPPPGRQGWPWTADGTRLPGAQPNDAAWPRITVITPSFNQADFIEETLRSVLLQGYPALEYLVIDGGSSDGSVEMIRRYEPWLAFWESEPDRGQAHAINKGFARATGTILAWLNSDDTYLPGALATIASAFQRAPAARLVYGAAYFTDEAGRVVDRYEGRPLGPGWRRLQYWKGWGIPQPAVFFDRRLLAEHGGLDESYHYALDYEWLIRVSRQAPFLCLSEPLATYRMWAGSKTGDWEANKHRFFAECRRANRMHAPMYSPDSWPLWIAQGLHDARLWSRRRQLTYDGLRARLGRARVRLGRLARRGRPAA